MADDILVWVRGSDLCVGMTVVVAGRRRTISWLKWGKAPWMLDPSDPLKVPAARVEADANFAWTAYPSDHYQRVIGVGEQVPLGGLECDA